MRYNTAKRDSEFPGKAKSEEVESVIGLASETQRRTQIHDRLIQPPPRTTRRL
jgi:hypothetical protein